MDSRQTISILSRIKREAERKGIRSLCVKVKAEVYMLVWNLDRYTLHCVQRTDSGERTTVNPACVPQAALLELEQEVAKYQPLVKVILAA